VYAPSLISAALEHYNEAQRSLNRSLENLREFYYPRIQMLAGTGDIDSALGYAASIPCLPVALSAREYVLSVAGLQTVDPRAPVPREISVKETQLLATYTRSLNRLGQTLQELERQTMEEVTERASRGDFAIAKNLADALPVPLLRRHAEKQIRHCEELIERESQLALAI